MSKALELVLESIDGDNSEVEDLSDNDNPVEDFDLPSSITGAKRQ